MHLVHLWTQPHSQQGIHPDMSSAPRGVLGGSWEQHQAQHSQKCVYDQKTSLTPALLLHGSNN